MCKGSEAHRCACCVTGATGFLGRALARRLDRSRPRGRRAGARARCRARHRLDIEQAIGDIVIRSTRSSQAAPAAKRSSIAPRASRRSDASTTTTMSTCAAPTTCSPRAKSASVRKFVFTSCAGVVSIAPISTASTKRSARLRARRRPISRRKRWPSGTCSRRMARISRRSRCDRTCSGDRANAACCRASPLSHKPRPPASLRRARQEDRQLLRRQRRRCASGRARSARARRRDRRQGVFHHARRTRFRRRLCQQPAARRRLSGRNAPPFDAGRARARIDGAAAQAHAAASIRC